MSGKKKKLTHVLSAACFPFAHQDDGCERLFRNKKGCWSAAVVSHLSWVGIMAAMEILSAKNSYLPKLPGTQTPVSTVSECWGSLSKQGTGGWDSWLLSSGAATDFLCLLLRESYSLETRCSLASSFIMKSSQDLQFCKTGFSFPTPGIALEVFKLY